MLKAAEQHLPRRLRVNCTDFMNFMNFMNYAIIQSLWFYMLRIDDVSEVIKVDNSSVAKGHNVQVLAD